MKKPTKDLKSEISSVAVVTGAAGGIGLACTVEFLKAGFRVVMLDRIFLPKVSLSGAADKIFSVRADISKESAVESAVEKIVRKFGRIDVLVNNAAILTPTKPAHETSLLDFESLMVVNVRGTFLMCKHAYPQLRRTKGCIVNVSSMAGVMGEKNHAAYAASKGAINALTKSMAIDYGKEGVRVNAVCPGGISTLGAQKVLKAAPGAKKLIKMRDSIHGLARCGTPEEVASAVAFLASPAAAFISGALLPLSGGMECGYGIKY